MIQKRGQVALYVLIAVGILAAILAIIFFWPDQTSSSLSPEFEGPYASFLSCVQDEVSFGVALLGSQGGYIDLPSFVPGSSYSPFSNYLFFLGQPIPYWWTLSQNALVEERVPSRGQMERALNAYLTERIPSCVPSSALDEGYEMIISAGEVDSVILDNEVRVSFTHPVLLALGSSEARVTSHEVVVGSSLGALHSSAVSLYEQEQTTFFLENYALDTLRLTAPVDGVALSCSPLTWNAEDIFDEVSVALTNTYASLRTEGSSVSVSSPERAYFEIPFDEDVSVQFVYDPSWPSSFSVAPSEGPLLLSEPVGLQPGLGILGFCYVPYHYVYSLRFPVLVQLSEGDEIFQFPHAVIVEGNRPREPANGTAVSPSLPELCSTSSRDLFVTVFDSQLRGISDAEVVFECVNTHCPLGTTNAQGALTTTAPQCANGFVRVLAEGYSETRSFVESASASSVEVFLAEMTTLPVRVLMQGAPLSGTALVTFASDTGEQQTLYYPEIDEVTLSQGDYTITVQAFRNTSLTLSAQQYEQCVDVPSQGLLGLFGSTKEECFDIEIPPQVVSYALSGGGEQQYYVLASELETAQVVELSLQPLPVPGTLEQLQENYLLVEDRQVGVTFR